MVTKITSQIKSSVARSLTASASIDSAPLKSYSRFSDDRTTERDRTFQNFLESSRTNDPTRTPGYLPEHSRTFQNIPEHSGMFSKVLERSGTIDSTRTPRYLPEHSRTFQNIHEFSGTFHIPHSTHDQRIESNTAHFLPPVN
jgi:hypothetical protein